MENNKVDVLIEKVRELSQEFPEYKMILARVISEANEIKVSQITVENMKVESVGSYRDGGTISIETSNGEFCINYRLGDLERHGLLFKGYPDTGKGALPTSDCEVVLKALMAYKVEGKFDRFSRHDTAISDLLKIVSMENNVTTVKCSEAQKLVEETTLKFSVLSPNMRQLLDAKEKALVSLKSTLEILRVLTRECEIENVPNVYKDVQEAIEILKKDINL